MTVFIMLLLRTISLLVLMVLLTAEELYKQSEYFEISVVHINDVRARSDETGGNYKNNAEGVDGYSKLFEEISSILSHSSNSILLNAGDDYLGRWNKLPITASTIGNHEFYGGIEGLVSYIKTLHHPVIISNVNETLESSFQGICSKSIVIERNGKRIGIIGVTKSNSDTVFATRNLTFLPESTSVNVEANRLSKEEGVFTNIVLSHCGYEIDRAIAENASEKISLIVGSHSDVFRTGRGNFPGPDLVKGPYPTFVESKYGHKVIIAEAPDQCNSLGNITVFLDGNGEVVNYSGAPIYIDPSFPQAEEINPQLFPRKTLVDAKENTLLGSSLVTLSYENCLSKECTFGNFATDAMVYAYTNNPENESWAYASMAILNSDVLQGNLHIGDITFSDLLAALPLDTFTVDVGEIEGKYIKDIFESHSNSTNILQISGIKVVYNFNRPQGERVESLKLRCQSCHIPRYEQLDLNKSYRLIVTSLLAAGEKGYATIPRYLKNVSVGPLNTDVFSNYLLHRSPVFQEQGGRINIYEDKGGNKAIKLRALSSYCLLIIVVFFVFV